MRAESRPDAGRFGQQIAGENQNNCTNNAQHADFGPLRLTLACLVELGERLNIEPLKKLRRELGGE